MERIQNRRLYGALSANGYTSIEQVFQAGPGKIFAIAPAMQTVRVIEELLQLFKNASLEFSGTNWEKYLTDVNNKELSAQEKDANWATTAGDDCIKEWCATGEEIYLSKIRLLPFEIPALASYHGIPATLQAVYESYETLVPEMSERQVVLLTHCMRVAEMLQPGDAWETCRRKLDEALEHRKTEEGRVYFKPHITDIYEACFRAAAQQHANAN